MPLANLGPIFEEFLDLPERSQTESGVPSSCIPVNCFLFIVMPRENHRRVEELKFTVPFNRLLR